MKSTQEKRYLKAMVTEPTDCYQTDFYQWTQEQARLIQSHAWARVDWQHILEEIESLGRQEKKELVNRLEVLLHQPHDMVGASPPHSMYIRVEFEDKNINQFKEKPSTCEELSTGLVVDFWIMWHGLNYFWVDGRIDWYCDNRMQRIYFVESNPPHV